MKFENLRGAVKLFSRGFARYKKQLMALAVLGFLSGLLEGVGVNAVIPLFSIVSGNSTQNPDTITRLIQHLFNLLHLTFSLRYLLFFIAGLFLIKAVTLIIFGYINVKITSEYEKRTRAQLFEDTLLAGWPYLIRQKIGYLEQVILTDISKSANLLRHLAGLILLATNLIMYILVAVNISPLLTGLTIAIGAIIFLFFKQFFFKGRMLARKQAAVTKQVAHLVNENMMGVKSIKAAKQESQIIKKSKEYFNNLQETSILSNFIANLNNNLTEPVGVLFILALFAISYKLPDFNFASFAVMIYLIQRMFSYLQVAQDRLQTISELTPYLSSAISYHESAVKNREVNSGRKNFIFDKKLEFKNVTFGYNPDKIILEKVDFGIQRGEMAGVIGPSGAGKTTVVDLLLRLFSPQKGRITIDNIPIEEIDLESWRKKISYVSQDIFMLNDTIANNIRFYDESVTLEQIVTAAKTANIYDFIMDQPKQFDTVVGERGLFLSGGQRQRVILARALVKSPEILVLDEATSALDNESEQMIQKAIENLKGKVTTIIIAHRLSTVMNCDNLIILNDGQIVETGSPTELRENKNSYFYLSLEMQNQASTGQILRFEK